MERINPIEILILGCLIVLLLMLIVDFSQLRNIKKLTQQDSISVDKYHELKWRINLLISITAIVSIILGYLGLTITNGITSNLEKLEYQVSSIDTSRLNDVVQRIYQLESKSELLNNRYRSIDSQITNAQQKIRTVQQENLDKWDIKIIPFIKQNTLTVIPTEEINWGYIPLYNSPFGVRDTIFFKDLITIDNEKLPLFTEPPLIQVVNTTMKPDSVRLKSDIIKIEKDYFLVEQNLIVNSKEDYVEGDYERNMSVWIFVR